MRQPLPTTRPNKSRPAELPQKGRPGHVDKPSKILLVDDHPVVREGLAELIRRHQGLEVVGQAGHAVEALEMVQKLNPDLVVLDLYMPGVNGIELIKRIRAQQVGAALLVLSMHDESVYAERVLRAGARGYVMKQEASEKIIGAIEQVLGGEIYLSDRMKGAVLENLASGRKQSHHGVDNFSDRELEVFQLIGDGFSTRQVAERLGLSIKTIESYRESLKLKLGLQDSKALVQHAIQWNRANGALR